MSFDATISTRISETRQALDEARSAGDDYLMEVRLGELESLARLAADHEIRIEGLTEALAAHGVSTPSVGVPLVDQRDDQRRVART